jgi:hypothetical protein
MKIESGVMVMKGGMAWGIKYSDGKSTETGWVAPEDAPIYDPRFCRRPSDATYQGSPDEEELRNGKLVHVERRTEVIIHEENP